MKHWIAGAAATALVGVVALTALFGFTQTASAAKWEPFIIEIDCGADGTLEVALNRGNGQYTPAKIVDGGVLIPVAFSNQHGTFTDNEGNVEEFADPDSARPGPKNKDFVNCHFEITFEDENGTADFEGDVKAFIVGR